MDYADYGRYLSQQRELRGLSRDHVSRQTKISPALIDALEAGHLDRLPGRIFVLNYIRSYAAAIGLSPEEAILRFEELDKTVKSVPPPPALERQRRTRAWIILGVVLAVCAAAGYAFFAGALRR